jgi:hypothetical protein
MPNKPTLRDPINDEQGKVYDSQGRVAADGKAKRKELIEELVNRLQGTMDNTISGSAFLTKIDMVGNHIFDMKNYVLSLKEACFAIKDNYPDQENDDALDDLSQLCDVIHDGSERCDQYLFELRAFADDLNNIKKNVYDRLIQLHSEI